MVRGPLSVVLYSPPWSSESRRPFSSDYTPLLGLNTTQASSATMALVPMGVLNTLASILLLIILRTLTMERKKRRLPPGPAGLPVVGNILDMPKTREWETFARWGERWGMSFYGFYPGLDALNNSCHRRHHVCHLPWPANSRSQ